MNALADKQILVTGGTGFLGSRLCEVLSREENAKVTGLGRNLEKASHLEKEGINLKSVDLQDTEALRQALEGQEIVFHAAAVLGADPETAHAINVEATKELVRLAGEAGVARLVHVSTVGVYDMSDRDEVDESTPLAYDHPSNYPRTKALAEKMAREMAAKYNLELAIVRPSMIYGPGHGVWSEGMFKNIQEGNPVFLGDGSAHFNPVYIDDVVDSMIRCATSPNAPGESFNISADITTWREFMGYYGEISDNEAKGLPLFIARLMAWANKIPGVQTPIDAGFIEMATSYKYFLIDKAKEKLGWEPNTPLEEGIQKTTRWLEEEFLDSESS
jgi:nucleoside-diphosphate-sugar epimerase